MSMIDDRDRPAGAQSGGANNPIDDDPLAELIRIVKEEDPFGDVLAWQPGGKDGGHDTTESQQAAPQAPRQPSSQQPQEQYQDRGAAHARHESPSAPPPQESHARPSAEPVRHEDPHEEEARPARRRGPPPLEPIALEEALREFREVPDEHYRAPRDEYDPTSIPDDESGYGDSQAADEAASYSTPQQPGQPQHAAYHEDAPAPVQPEAYYGDVIEDEDADPYDDPAFADVGTDEYADDGYARATVADAPAFDQPRDAGVQPDPAVVAAANQHKAPRGRRGLFFGAGVILGLAVLAGLFLTLFQSGGDAGGGGPLPVIRANNDPAKMAPSDPGGANIPNQERLVYNRVSGEEGEPDTRLVSREEEVMDQAGDKAPDRFPGLNGNANTGETISKDEPGAVPAGASPNQNSSVTPQPRRVRTLTVGPDGSLTPAPEEPPAPPVRAQPEPASPPEPVRTAANQPRQAQPQPEQQPRASVTPTRPAQREAAPVQPIREEAAAQPVRRTQAPGQPLALNPNPVPAAQARPGQPSAPVQAQPQQAAPVRQQVAAAAPTASTPPAVSSQGEYVVQLAARKSEEQALGAYDALQGQYSGLLGRYKPLIQRADLGDRGVYYRVRVGPMATADSANQLCGQLKAAGLNDCLVRRR